MEAVARAEQTLQWMDGVAVGGEGQGSVQAYSQVIPTRGMRCRGHFVLKWCQEVMLGSMVVLGPIPAIADRAPSINHISWLHRACAHRCLGSNWAQPRK